MLYNIIKVRNQALFMECLDNIKRSLWWEDKITQIIQADERSRNPANFEISENDIERYLRQIEDENKEPGLYVQISENDPGRKHFLFPYSFPYYNYFTPRKWIRENETVHYETDSKVAYRIKNIDHFMNVIAAMAHLINYFSSGHIEQKQHNLKETIVIESLIKENLLFKQGVPDSRTFRLMLCAYLHDIGKTVVDYRHGIEGSIIISDHTSKSWCYIDTIISSYEPGIDYRRDDLFLIADFLYYHDIYGTLSTGESNYTGLIKVINKLAHYDVHPDNQEEKKGLLKQFVFDLWLLNVADIIVSIRNKMTEQEEWKSCEKALETIDNFFDPEESPQSAWLCHDLYNTFILIDEYEKANNGDYTRVLAHKAQTMSINHTIERTKRLLTATLKKTFRYADFIRKEINSEEYEKIRSKISTTIYTLDTKTNSYIIKEEIKEHDAKEICEYIFNNGDYALLADSSLKNHYFYTLFTYIYNDLKENDPVIWNTVVRTINSIQDLGVFSTRFSRIGKLDYAFSFFCRLIKRALDNILRELNEEKSTGWIWVPREKEENDKNDIKEKLIELDSILIIENYASILIQILDYLFIKEPGTESMRNIEFYEVLSRLTNDKIDKILGLEGPYRMRRAIQLILETIFIY